MLTIFFMGDLRGGGTKTYTAHLVKALRAIGKDARICRVGNKTFNSEKDFGYGLKYRNISLDAAIRTVQIERTLITSTEPKSDERCASLLYHGARLVIHDPREIKDGKYKGHTPVENLVKPFVIRKSNRNLSDDSVYIPHPYVPYMNKTPEKKNTSICLTRIANSKHIDWLLRANRNLPKSKQITIRGAEDRMYSFFVLKSKFPEWSVGNHSYDQSWGEAQRLYKPHIFAIDLTEIANDGGGSQYSFLEAMDAGCIPVLHRSWFKFKGEMKEGVNCLGVESQEELEKVLLNSKVFFTQDIKRFQEEGRKTLDLHDPIKIAKKYVRELGI